MRERGLRGLILIIMLSAVITGCDGSSAPKEEEDFILAVMVTDTDGQPLEGMAVGRLNHLEGTIPDPPSPAAASSFRVTGLPLLPDSLLKAYPNPFNGVNVILFSLSDVREAVLDVKDWRGRHVRTILQGLLPAGMHSVEWNQRDESGDRVITGVYRLVLTLSDTLDTHLYTFSDSTGCTNFDFLDPNRKSMGETDPTGFFSTRDLDPFPSLQGHGQQRGYDPEGYVSGIFWFSETVTIKISSPPAEGSGTVYHMSRDADLVDGPNYIEFVFVPDDSTEAPVSSAR